MLTPRVRQPSTISKRSYLTRRGHADSLTSWQIFGKSWMSGSATLNWPVFFFMSVRFLRSFAYLLESIIPSLQLWVQNRYGHAFLSFPLIPSILCLGIISKASFGNFKIGNMAFSFSRLPSPPERQRRKKKTLPQHHYRISIEFTKEKKEYIDVDVCKRKSAYIIWLSTSKQRCAIRNLKRKRCGQ